MKIGSRRQSWACVALLLLATLLLHREVLCFGQIYHGEDAADGYYPSHVAILRALRHLELPTWERGSWSGWPLAADPYYGLFYPFSLLFALFGPARGLGIAVALHSFFAGVGMLWLMRRRGLAHAPALFAAVSLAFGSFMVERIRHVIFIEVMAWLPFILVGVEGFFADRRARWLALAAAATAMALVSGGLPLAPFAVVVIGAYVLARLSSLRRERLRIGCWIATAAAVGGLLAACQVVLTVLHLPHSPRSLGVDETFASSYAWPQARYLALLALPNVMGGAERGQWLGLYNHWEMAGWYTGLWTLLLAPLALLRRKRELVLLFLVALLAVGLAFGSATPLHPFFFHHVPLYGALRCPTRALVMALFALPIVAGEGLAWLTAWRPSRDRTWAPLLALVFIAAGGAAALLLSRPGTSAPPIAAARQAAAHAALVASLGLGLLTVFAGRRLGGVALGWGMALLSLGDLLAIARGYVQPHPASWVAGTERFAAVDWLLAQHPKDRFVTDAGGPFRLHNLGMSYDLEGAGGYESFTVWRYVNFLYTLNHGRPYPFPKLKEDLAAGDIRRFDSPLVDLLNVRWFIGAHAPGPGWVERFRPRPGAPVHATHEPVWDPQLAVFENPRVLPRAFVVHEALVLGDERLEAERLTSLEPRRLVLLDQTPVPAPSGSGMEPARLLALERHHVLAEVDLRTPGILVLSDTWYPGWEVSVDDRPAQLLRADYALRGVALEAGPHTVEFTFHSRPARLGLLLTLFGLLCLGLLGVVGRRWPWLL